MKFYYSSKKKKKFDIARDLWSLLFCLFGMKWVMPYRVVDLLACWKEQFARHRSSGIWKVIPLCINGPFGENEIGKRLKELNNL